MIDYGDKGEKPKVGFEQIAFPEHNTAKPSFQETITAVVKNNDFVNIAGSLKKIFDNNGLVSYEDQDITDFTDQKYYAGVPNQYWDKIAASVATGSSREVEATRKQIEEELHDQDILNRSGFLGGALSLTSAFVSPTTFIPMAASAKYADFSKSFLSGFKQILPTAIATSAISATAQSMNHETFGAKEWAHQMFFDTIMSTGLSAIVGAKRVFDAKGIQKVQGALNSIHDGVDIKIKTNEHGQFAGYEAEAKGGSASAARVKQVQDFLDNGIAKVGENFFFQKAFKASPIVRALTSPFNTTRQLANRMWKHNLVTGSIEKGYIEGATAQDIFMDWVSIKDGVQLDVKNAWIKYVGIDKGVFKGTRAWKEAGKKGLLDEKRFREEVGVAMRNGDTHAIPEVQDMAQHIRKNLYEPFYNKLVELGKLNPNFDVATAQSYLNRIYDKGLIIADPTGFTDILVEHYKDINKERAAFLAPLTQLKSQIAGLKESAKVKGMKPEVKKQMKAEIGELQKQYKLKEKELQGMIDRGEVPLKLLESRQKLTKELMDELEQLHAPINQANEELAVAKKAYAKEKTKENRAKVKEANSKLKAEKESLNTRLIQEEISPELVYHTKKGQIKLKKLEEKTWFRKSIPEDRMQTIANETRDTILEESDEALAGKIFRDVSQGSPSPLKNRTVLIEDNKMQRFFVNDINNLMDSYANALGKNIALEEMFLKYGETRGEGTEFFIKQLKNEYEKMRNDILTSEVQSEARDIRLTNLKRDFEKEQEFMRDQFKLFMGTLGDPNSKLKRATQAMRNYNVATQLGALALTSLTDLTMPIFRFGFWNYLEKGVIPTIKNFKKLMIEGKAQRADFAHARIACETALGGVLDEKWGAGTQYQPKMLWERIPKNLASLSGNLSLANQQSDLFQTFVSMASQSRILENLERYVAGGKLSQKEIERFGLLALNPQEWGERILRQVKKYGENVDGGWIANVRNWSDFDAAQAFRIAMRRELKASLSVQNSMDIPLAFRMPVIDCITQYMSWGFGATNNLFIPLLQRADAEKMTGIFTMMAIGAMIGPLRQLASGREVDLKPESLFAGAIFDGGPFGWQADVLSKLNSVLRVPYLEKLKQDKYRQKTPWQLLGGPLGGTLETAQRMVNMLLNGEINQNDLSRSIKLLPYADNVFLRRPVGAAIKATGLPETAAEARALKGE